MEPLNVTATATQFTSNAFLVDGETTTLVDAGSMPGVVDVITEQVESVDRVVLTHQHGDHIGALGDVLDAFDADLYAYADHPRRTDALGEGEEIRIGDEVCTVVHTPGHADDHVSLVGDESLYSGDVVVYNDGAFDDGSFGRTDRPEQSREQLIESLRAILSVLPDSVSAMYPGHGRVFHAEDGGDDVRTVIERALERAERRQPKYPDE